MDVKLPGSTGLKDFWGEHMEFLEVASKKEVFLKAVVCESTKDKDLLETVSFLKKFGRSVIFVLQPDSYEDSPSMKTKLEKFRNACIKEDITACVIPQIHKIMGVR
jgi:organic radical activating enzyme